jgi:serine/threonine protein kinase
MARLTDRYRIENFIDTFALGHYARVLSAHDKRTSTTVAFKVLRPEHLDPDGDTRWEYKAFANEADLLTRLGTQAQVIRLLDCGYIESGAEAPASGEMVAFEGDAAAFAKEARGFAEKGWRPFLVQEYIPRTRSMFYLMRPDKANATRQRLPTEEGLSLAMQFADLLRAAHRQNIVYLDHKLEHVYWDGTTLRVIDWNSSRLLAGTDKENEAVFRQDVHNLCVGILYSLFTGMSPQKTALRPQPGSQSEVEARYADITALDFGSEPTLSPGVQKLLQQGAAMQLHTADDLSYALREVAIAHGWDFPGAYTSPHSRDARAAVRAGLAKVRQGEEALREARDLFLDAATLDDLSEEQSAELMRLARAVGDMLAARVVP